VEGVNKHGHRRAAAMTESLPEPSSETPSLDDLREALIEQTIILADELAADGDADRIETLSRLYEITREALRRRDERAAR
jgi:hypothetical protein